MIGILVVTHGGFSEGLLNAVELIAGKQEKVKTIGLYHGDGIDEFTDKVQDAYEALNEGDGVMAFVDVFGGSPSNAVMKLIAKGTDVRAIAGVNMPMLVEAFMSRESYSLDELCEVCSQSGIENEVLLYEKYKEMMTKPDTEEEDF